METHLIALLAVAAIWLAAGVLADRLPGAGRARRLRRHAGWLLVLTLTGLGLMGAVGIAALSTPAGTGADQLASALLLPAVPALVVMVCTVRRLRWLQAGAATFATAPRTPTPPGLLAAAAHPLIGLPLQVSALATLCAVLIDRGAGGWLGGGLAGPALTVGGLAVVAIGVRHALRHSRFAERSVNGRLAGRVAGSGFTG
jgi:hypothetical protein